MSAREPVGTAAEEAVRLLGAVEDWARRRGLPTELLTDPLGSGRDAVREQLGGLHEHLATGSVACTVCPVCQVIGAVRSVRPETVEHLLDAAASVVAALRSTVQGGAASPGEDVTPDRPTPRAARPERVERIPVQDVQEQA